LANKDFSTLPIPLANKKSARDYVHQMFLVQKLSLASVSLLLPSLAGFFPFFRFFFGRGAGSERKGPSRRGWFDRLANSVFMSAENMEYDNPLLTYHISDL